MSESENHEAEAELDKSDIEVQGRKSNGITRRLIGTLLVFSILIVAVGAFALYFIDKRLNQPNSFDARIYEIAKGDTLNSFITQLQNAGVIAEPFSISAYARYKQLGGKLHTGHYQFEDGMSLIDVLDSITSGKYQLSHQFTFVQGSTFKQLRNALRAAESLIQTLGDKSDKEVLRLFDTAEQYSHPEGLFFPETYAYLPGETDQDLLHRAYQAMQKTLADLWKSRAKNIKISMPYEALIMASIIEKETGLASERALISGVFENRLVKGMRLQTDPTVIYGIGDQYNGNITRKHLKTDTPYNTYTRYGLTPTPICMPGRAAIKAALNPARTDSLYFVAKGDGSRGHNFSKTLIEHNRAVKKYIKAVKSRG